METDCRSVGLSVDFEHPKLMACLVVIQSLQPPVFAINYLSLHSYGGSKENFCGLNISREMTFFICAKTRPKDSTKGKN
jgi:hypothetical protein